MSAQLPVDSKLPLDRPHPAVATRRSGDVITGHEELMSGGDATCRAQSHSQRLDLADARAFLGQYLNLP